MSIKLLQQCVCNTHTHTQKNEVEKKTKEKEINNIYEQNEIRSCYLCTKPFQLRNYQ